MGLRRRAPEPGRIVTDDVAAVHELPNDGKPALCFAAHLGNWELPVMARTAWHAVRGGLPNAEQPGGGAQIEKIRGR